MAERFEKLFELQNNLYTQGSPVIVAAGALLKDTQSSNVIVQLKFHSVSEVTIKALKVGIAAFDVTGKAIEGVEEYQYLDLKIQNGEEFGSNKAVVLPNIVARSFKVSTISVVLSDDSIKTVTMPLEPLKKAETLQSFLHDTEMVKQYQIEVNEKAKYVPQEDMGLWQCACGEWNRGEFCAACKTNKDMACGRLNYALLEKKKNTRLLEEERNLEEQRRNEEAREKEYARQRERECVREQEACKRRKRDLTKAAMVGGIITILVLVYLNIIQPNIAYRKAEHFLAEDKYYNAAVEYYKLGGYKDSWSRSFETWGKITNRATIAAGADCSVSVKTDGSVIATEYIGDHYHGQCEVAEWKNIVAISAGEQHTVGLLENGKVIATPYLGDDNDGQCDVQEWEKMVAVSAGGFHTVGLKADGTVTAVGDNKAGQCDISEWTDVIAVAAGHYHTVGLHNDGTVSATKFKWDKGFYDGQCEVSEWDDIVAISAGFTHTVGLKSDGTVVAVGSNSEGQCEVTEWKDIVYISAGWFNTVGIKSDGTVVSTKIAAHKNYGQSSTDGWKNIVSVTADYQHSLGLRVDGTVVATVYTGNKDSWDHYNGQCEVTGWHDIAT